MIAVSTRSAFAMSFPEVALAGGYARSVTEMSESWKPDQMPRLTTTGSVRRAVAEYDRLGRKRFLETYGFGASRRYLLRLDGRLYESKAIVGVAFKYETPDGPLRASQFSGGVGPGAAARQLQELGFEIIDRPEG